MPQQDAINYQEANNGQSCQNCKFGQFDSVCLNHNFKHAPTHTCDTFTPAAPISLKSFQVVDLPRPHGYLIWHGKQSAIASPTPLSGGKVLITSDNEAYGLAMLGQPAQMTLSEFEREEQADKHRVRPEERKMLWPKVEALYVHSIKEWNGFNEPQPIIDGHITLYQPTPDEEALIEKSKRLPKIITLEEEAVCLTDGGFTALDGVRGKELSEALKAVYGQRFRFLGSKGDKALPLYDLALVRQPALRFEKILSRVLSAEKAHNGVMVAFMLPAAAAAKLALSQDALPEGATVLPPEELHLTLSYLGKKDELEGRELIERVLSTLAQEWPPLMGKIGGIGRFSKVESDGTQAFYASFDSQDLPDFRQELVSRLAAAGVKSPSEHGFTPHITLAYLPQGAEIPNITLPDTEVSFESLTLAWGDEHLSYPLTGPSTGPSTSSGGASGRGQVKKKSTKEAEVMPTATMDAAEVEAGEKRSLQDLEQIRERFLVKFCRHDYGDYRDNPWPIDITDDDRVIVTWQGTLHEVPFTRTENGEIVFTPQLQWSPVTTQYVRLQSEAMKATTKTENEMDFSRSAYLYTPSDKPSEWKLRIEAEPGQVTKAQLGAAAAALSSGGFRGQQVELSAEEKQAAARKLIAAYRKLDVADDEIPDHLWNTADMKPAEQAKAGRRLASGWMDKLRAAKDALLELASWAEYADREDPSTGSGTEEPEEDMAMIDMLKGSSGVAVKMVGGEPWHCSWSSNAFQDRDEETFSLKSLERYVQENEENEVKGWFNLWHIKGTDFAEKRYQAIIGKFLFEAGPYLKDEKGRKALEFFKEHPNGHSELAPEGWGASVEYRYLPEERKEKVYSWTWITRTSTLARGAAANIWTKSSQEIFEMTDEQKKAAVAMFGEEFTNQLIVQGEQKTKELEEAGVASKQAGQGTTPEATQEAPGEKKPVETPATPPAASGTPAANEAPAQVADPNQLLQTLAAEMIKSLNEALTPVLTEIKQEAAGIKQDIQALGDRVGTLETEQATKQKIEMPRFVFSQLMASQSQGTVVPEGDALKNQKPKEALEIATDGSVASAYFPARK